MVSRFGIALLFVFSIILTTCSPATTAPAIPLPSMQPSLPPSTSVPTSEPVGVGVPVIDYLDQQNKLHVISSVTGKALDAFKPIPLGGNYDQVYSPDGHTLALVTDGQLYLIDLPSWKYRTSDVGIYGPISSMVYSSDGTLLALAGNEPGGDLRIVDAISGQVKGSVQAGFSIRSIKFTADGKAIMVYGPHIASTGDAANAGVSVGAPFAALLAATDLSVLWSVELSGIRDGTFPKKPETANTQLIYVPGSAWHFQPGIAFDPNHDKLYLVHGDEDKLTSVDFTARKVSTFPVHVKTSWIDRLLDLTAGTAYAKGMDGTTKQAVISPDGKLLFVTGNTEVVSPQVTGGNWDITDTSTGLQVIAVEDGTLVYKMATRADSALLLPDGRYILLTGWNNDTYGTQWTDIFDISSRSIVKHLDNVGLTPTRRLDGKALLVSSSMVGDNVYYMALVDPVSWTITSSWKGSDYTGWLMTP